MEFTRWRKSISEMLAVTERNLSDEEWGGGGGAAPLPGVVGRQAAVVPLGAEKVVQGDVYVDSSLAYRLDSITLQVATLQKDLDYYKASRGGKEADYETRAVTLLDKVEHLRKQQTTLETHITERVNTIEETVLETRTGVLSRMPGRSLESSEPYVPKADYDHLVNKVKLLEDYVKRVESNARGVEASIRSTVQDEVDARMSDIRSEALSGGRRAAATEMKCRLDMVKNDIDEQLASLADRARTDTVKALADFKASQATQLDTSITHVLNTSTALKSSLEGLTMWKDIADSRIGDLESDKASTAARHRQETLQLIDEQHAHSERAIQASEDRLKRMLDSSASQAITHDRVDTLISQLRQDVQSATIKVQTQESRIERAVSSLQEGLQQAHSSQIEELTSVRNEHHTSITNLRKEVQDGVRAAVQETQRVSQEIPIGWASEEALAKSVRNLSSTIGTVEGRIEERLEEKLASHFAQQLEVVAGETRLCLEQVDSLQGSLQSVMRSPPGSPMRREVRALEVRLDQVAQQPRDTGSPVRKVEGELAALREKVKMMEDAGPSMKRELAAMREQLEQKEKVVLSPKKGDRPPLVPREEEGVAYDSADSGVTANLLEMSRLVKGTRQLVQGAALDCTATDSLIDRLQQVRTDCQLPANRYIHHSPKHATSAHHSISTDSVTADDSDIGSSTPSSISEEPMMRDFLDDGSTNS